MAAVIGADWRTHVLDQTWQDVYTSWAVAWRTRAPQDGRIYQNHKCIARMNIVQHKNVVNAPVAVAHWRGWPTVHLVGAWLEGRPFRARTLRAAQGTGTPLGRSTRSSVPTPSAAPRSPSVTRTARDAPLPGPTGFPRRGAQRAAARRADCSSQGTM